MKKLILRLFLLVIILGVISVAVLWWFGYQRYRESIEEVPLAQKVDEIITQENYVNYEEISPFFVAASVSTEDQRFFSRTGIDFIAFGRAMLNNLTQLSFVEGGSTIGQQTVKNMYYSHSASATRKVAELYLMLDLEEMLSKEEVFALYANIIYFGDGYTGIYDASMGYFEKLPSELTLEEASLLAGLPQSPSRYQLSDGGDLAVERHEKVLQSMVNEDVISQTQAEQALAWSQENYSSNKGE